jgi:hypothetical protein
MLVVQYEGLKAWKRKDAEKEQNIINTSRGDPSHLQRDE